MNFPNIIYNIKDCKYDQYSVVHWIKYYVYYLSERWINPFELFLIKHTFGGNKMKLLVFYTVRMIDDFQNSVIDKPEQVSVCVPDNLLQSEFMEFVTDKYFKKIENLEKDCCGSLRYYKLNIDYVKLLTELKS